MSKIIVEQKSLESWGKCIRISNGDFEIFATLEIGPRIIRLGKIGGPNEFYENPSRNVGKFGSDMQPVYKEGEKWLNYGGHRLWHAPEALPRTYLPENYPVECEFISNGVRLTPRPIMEIGMQNSMEITMSEDGQITVVHKVTNIGAWPVEIAPWAITVLAHGGVEVVPLSVKQTGLLSNRNLILWPYTRINDERVTWDDKYVMIRPNANKRADDEDAFKFGTNLDNGYAMYFNNNNLFVKYFDYEEGVSYPDNGCNFETYTDKNIIECETLGKLCTLNPGETATHTEKWNFYLDVPAPQTASDVDAIVKKYVIK